MDDLRRRAEEVRLNWYINNKGSWGSQESAKSMVKLIEQALIQVAEEAKEEEAEAWRTGNRSLKFLVEKVQRETAEECAEIAKAHFLTGGKIVNSYNENISHSIRTKYGLGER